MSLNFIIITEMIFSICYLTYIFLIVIFISKNLKKVNKNELKAAKNILLAFISLLIGDFGHVGARLIIFFSKNNSINSALFGIGILFEMVGLTFLFIFCTNLWRIHFNRPNDILFKVLIGIGIFSLIVLALPQNQWITNSASYEWIVFRNIPWLIQGCVIAILIIREAKAVEDSYFIKIGFLILLSLLFYCPVIFFGHFNPRLGILMIPGTFIFMLWQYFSYRRFFKESKSNNSEST